MSHYCLNVSCMSLHVFCKQHKTDIWELLVMKNNPVNVVSLPDPRCQGSWHHLLPGLLGSFLQVLLQSAWISAHPYWVTLHHTTLTIFSFKSGQTKKSGCVTHDETASFVWAGEQSWRVGIHLVLQPGGCAVIDLSSQRVPEAPCSACKYELNYEDHIF